MGGKNKLFTSKSSNIHVFDTNGKYKYTTYYPKRFVIAIDIQRPQPAMFFGIRKKCNTKFVYSCTIANLNQGFFLSGFSLWGIQAQSDFPWLHIFQFLEHCVVLPTSIS